MTLPVGTISLSDVNTELGYSSTALVSLNDTAVRSLANVPSGAISMSDLQGKSASFAATYSSNTTSGLNLRTWALANGWNGSSTATITISNGTYLQSNNTSTPALTINGSWPGGVTVIVAGYVVGAGGPGGVNTVTGLSGVVGGNGGNAISLGVNCAIQINSTGAILGGGGGGASALGGGGGGAGGGLGATPWLLFISSGGAGGFAGANGNDGTNGGNGSVFVGTGAGGGSNLAGLTGGSTLAGGAGGVNTYGSGAASGGGGGGSSTYGVTGGNGGNTSASGGGTAGGSGGSNGGGGGGGFGQSGGSTVYSGVTYAGGTAGKAIALNGYTATLSGTTTNVWGAVS